MAHFCAAATGPPGRIAWGIFAPPLTPIRIHELVSRKELDQGTASPSGDVAARCLAWENVYDKYVERNWGELAEALEAFLRSHPDDALAELYLERAEHFVKEPPGDDWNGVEEFSTK